MKRLFSVEVGATRRVARWLIRQRSGRAGGSSLPAILLGTLLLGLCGVVLQCAADDWTVDFRYAPERWQTCIGLPDDPFKTIVGHDGGLYYDYSKVSGRRFGTQLLAELDTEAKVSPKSQQLHSARVPVVTTRHKHGALELRQVAWANAPTGQSVDEWSAKRADFLSLTVANTGQAPADAQLRLKAGATVLLKLDDARTRLVKEDGQTFCWFSRPCLPVKAEAAPLSAVRPTVSRCPTACVPCRCLNLPDNVAACQSRISWKNER